MRKKIFQICGVAMIVATATLLTVVDGYQEPVYILSLSEQIQIDFEAMETSINEIVVKIENEKAEAEAEAERLRLEEERIQTEQEALAQQTEEEQTQVQAETPVVQESVVQNSSQTLGTETYVGQIQIPSQGIDLAMYTDSDYNNAQNVVDKENAAFIHSFRNTYMFEESMVDDWSVIIADHNYQGFSAILNLGVGDEVWLVINGSTYKYQYKSSAIFPSEDYIKNLGGCMTLQTCYSETELCYVYLEKIN